MITDQDTIEQIPESSASNTLKFFDTEVFKSSKDSILCGVVGTFMFYPLIFDLFGIVYGLIIIVLVLVINWTSNYGYLYGSKIAQSDDYIEIANKVNGTVVKKITLVTFFIEYFVIFILNYLFAYDISNFAWKFWTNNVSQDSPDYEITGHTYLFRAIVFLAGYVVAQPFCYVSDVNKLTFLNTIFVGVMLFFILLIIIELIFFTERSKNSIDVLDNFIARKEWTSSSLLIIVFALFYFQTIFLATKSFFTSNSFNKAKKSLTITHVVFLIIFLVFALLVYTRVEISYNSLNILTEPNILKYLPPALLKFHLIMLFALSLLFLLYCSYFSVCLRNYITSKISANINKYILNSVPLFLAGLVSILFTNVTKFITIEGPITTFYNGFALPLSMLIILYKKSILKRIGVIILFTIMLFVAVISFVTSIYNFANQF